MFVHMDPRPTNTLRERTGEMNVEASVSEEGSQNLYEKILHGRVDFSWPLDEDSIP